MFMFGCWELFLLIGEAPKIKNELLEKFEQFALTFFDLSFMFGL